VPPVADLIAGFDFAPSIGIYARSGTSTEVAARIASEVATIVTEPEVIRLFAAAGIEPAGAGADAFAAALKRESERIAKVVEQSGIKPQ
jgi:tripartite-type tricarboxylate transporter receptor subunit TctC